MTSQTARSRGSMTASLILVIISAATLVTGSADADWKSMSANECTNHGDPLSWRGRGNNVLWSGLERKRNYIRVKGTHLGMGAQYVYCPLERDTTSIDKSLDELSIYAQSGAGECTIYAISTTGQVLDSIGKVLESDGTTTFGRLDTDDSTTAMFTLACELIPGKKFYGYRYNEE